MEAAVANSFRASLVDLTPWLWFLKPGVGQYSHPILFKTFFFFGYGAKKKGLLISRGSYRWSFWWTVILCCLLVVCNPAHTCTTISVGTSPMQSIIELLLCSRRVDALPYVISTNYCCTILSNNGEASACRAFRDVSHRRLSYHHLHPEQSDTDK